MGKQCERTGSTEQRTYEDAEDAGDFPGLTLLRVRVPGYSIFRYRAVDFTAVPTGTGAVDPATVSSGARAVDVGFRGRGLTICDKCRVGVLTMYGSEAEAWPTVA